LGHYHQTRANRKKTTRSDHFHIPGLLFGGQTPHNEADDVKRPNVLVADLVGGVEVIHLYTGRPICQLTLMDGVYADINGDGIIDRIKAINEKDDGRFEEGCYALATTGIPVMDQLWNHSLCRSGIENLFANKIMTDYF